MKTTLKKTIAAMSAAAVVAASAAVVAAPVSAASSAVVTVNSVEVTVSELAANDYQVTMPITIANNEGYNTMGFTIVLPDELTYVKAKPTEGTNGCVANGNRIWFAVMSGDVLTGSDAGTLTVSVPSTAAAGDKYTVEALNEDSDGYAAPYGLDGEDVGLAGVNGGTITIVADPTDAPTEAPTEAPTAAPTEAPTAAPTATATTAAPTTGSPKTGDALPVAGVAVAVAVIGGVALVSKKRK